MCGATDVAPPPELYRTKSADFKGGGGDEKTNYNHSAQITIDDGYRAVFGSVGAVKNVWEARPFGRPRARTTHAAPGRRYWLWTTTLDDERDSIPLAIDTFHCSQVAVADRGQVPAHRPGAGEVAAGDLRQAADSTQGAGRRVRGEARPAQAAGRRRDPRPQPRCQRGDDQSRAAQELPQHPHRPALRPVRRGRGLPGERAAADRRPRGGRRGRVRALLRAGLRVGAHVLHHLPLLLGQQGPVGRADRLRRPRPRVRRLPAGRVRRVTVPARPGFEGAIDHFLDLRRDLERRPAADHLQPAVPADRRRARRAARPARRRGAARRSVDWYGCRRTW